MATIAPSLRVRFPNFKSFFYWIAIALLFLILLRPPIPQIVQIPTLFRRGQTPLFIYDFRICVADAALKYSESSNNNDFMTAFRLCIDEHIPVRTNHMDSYSTDQWGEKKYFLPLVAGHDQKDCRWLTVGVGSDTAAEKIFKEKYPECSVFAAEPSKDQQADFESYGKIVGVGVGIEDKTVPLVIRSGKSYVHRNVEVMSLTRFLDEHVGSRLVHFLTIDIEGFEYGIVRELVGDGKFAKDGVTFCQIDAEFHNPAAPKVVGEARNLSQAQYIMGLLRPPSPYLPIFNAPFLKHPHQKVTFVNIKNPDCEKAFKFSRYFG